MPLLMHFPFSWHGCKTAPLYYPCSQVVHYRLYSTFPARKKKNAPFWLKLVACVSLFFFISGTLSPLTIQGVSYFFKSLDNNILFDIPPWIMTFIFTAAGLIFHITARRFLAREIDSLKHRIIKKNKLERNTRTDVHKVK